MPSSVARSSLLKPKTDIHAISDMTPRKKDERVKEDREVIETSFIQSDHIKTTIDLATRRRIAQRSAETLLKHKERMDARKNKQTEDALVSVNRR